MRASEDEKLQSVGQEAIDQIKAQDDQARNTAKNMAANNVPDSLQSHITPERAEEIRYASQEFPRTPRMPKTASELGLEPPHAPQPAADYAPLKREHTMEDVQNSGGPGGAIIKPETKLPDWLQYLPSVEHSPDYKGLKWSVPLKNKQSVR